MNQAIESDLFYNSQSYVLFIYVNKPCVVIGRNQNPWKEVKLSSSQLVPLLRRLSGGGTVYHDLGNINFSFIYNEGESTVDENFAYIIEKLKLLGIDLYQTERKDLFFGSKKVSGNAFYRRGKRRLHHGTLLIDVDTSDLWKVLNFEHESYKCRSVASVKSPIINLAHVHEGIETQDVIDVLKGSSPIEIASELHHLHYYRLYRSEAWLYEETPDFEYMINDQLIQVKKGHIRSKIENLNGKLFNEELVKKEVENVTRIV
jgi:lipoate-protein ligase A